MVEIRLNIDEGIDRKDLKALRERFLSVNHDRLQRANLILSTRQQQKTRYKAGFLLELTALLGSFQLWNSVE